MADLQSIHVGSVRPAFSVVIPLFNKAPHICRAIQSVLAQTYPPDQVIVIDDQSTDGGADLVLPYTSAGVTLLKRDKPGAGGYAARNLGIETAQSEWIAFLDADDEWLPEHLSNLARAISTAVDPTEVVGTFTGYLSIYPNKRRSIDPFTRSNPVDQAINLRFEDLLRVWINLRECPIWTSAAAFRRRALLEAGLFPDGRAKRGGDKDTWLRVSSLGSLQFAPGVTAIYYRNAVNRVTDTANTNARHCMCDTVEALSKRMPERVNRLLLRMLNEEMFQYGIYGTESGAVDPDTYRDFRKSIDPVKFTILAFASTRIGAAAIRTMRHIKNRT